MCGISGIITKFPSDKSRTQRHLNLMSKTIQYRGPDQAGLRIDDHCGMSSQRLAITNLQKNSQPHFDEELQLTVMFNGEIYNHNELINNLADEFHFRDRSEIEVLAKLYGRFGRDCFSHLNGMFSISIFDHKKKELILCRDRFGKKPIYYYVDDRQVIFSSEIKAIVVLDLPEVKLDKKQLKRYFVYENIFEPLTPFTNIVAVQPAQHITFHLENLRSFSKCTYWKLPVAGQESNVTAEEASEEFKRLLLDATQIRIPKEESFTCLVSGGIDSAAIATNVSKLQQSNCSADSIIFKENSFDESSYQRDLIEKIKFDWTKFSFNDNVSDILNSYQEAMWISEYPEISFEQEVVLGKFYQSISDRGIKVALGGEGADELLRGYDWYYYYPYMEQFNKDFDLESIPYLGLQDDEIADLAEFEFQFIKKQGFPFSIVREFFNLEPLLRQDAFDRHIQPYLKDPFLLSCIEEDYQGEINSDFLQRSDIKRRLPNYILRTLDRYSMRASLEVRCPFLDFRLFEWYFSLPERLRENREKEKYLLHQAFATELPDSILFRQKQGYRAPALMTQHLKFNEFLFEILRPELIEELGIFNLAELDNLKKSVGLIYMKKNPYQLFPFVLFMRVIVIQLFYYTWKTKLKDDFGLILR